LVSNYAGQNEQRSDAKQVWGQAQSADALLVKAYSANPDPARFLLLAYVLAFIEYRPRNLAKACAENYTPNRLLCPTCIDNGFPGALPRDSLAI
jgi:hypothetical protein